MKAERYLERICYAGAVNCDMQTLESLQKHHLFAIPFEDIDIQTGNPIVLSTSRFYDKIVLRSRGGYCYELNGLFHQLLLSLGFDAYLVSARVVKGVNCGPEFDHLAIVVNMDGSQWLVDVGFGDFSLKPLLIGDTLVQFDGRQHYRIEETAMVDGQNYLLVTKWVQQRNAYVPAYYFSLTPRMLSEFGPMNHFQQTSPKSHFTQNLICSIPTEHGRISLINNKLIFSTGGVRKEMRVSSENVCDLLQVHFALPISPGRHGLTLKYTASFAD